jgi:hypothetical protein
MHVVGNNTRPLINQPSAAHPVCVLFAQPDHATQEKIKGEGCRALHTLIACLREIDLPHQERNFKMRMSLEQRSANKYSQ